MLLAAVTLGRLGSRVRKQRLVRGGLVAMSLVFALFGVLAWRFQVTNQQFVLDASVITLPVAGAALIFAAILLSLLLGLSMSSVNIVSQTLLQEYTPDRLRGRVFSVQFMLNNLVGIPPMLAVAALADLVGIPQILLGIGAAILLVLAITLRLQRQRRATPEATTREGAVAPEPAPEV
jgi:MFS family permease